MIDTFPFLRKTLDTNHLSEWSSTEKKDVNFSGNITIEKFLVLKSSTHQNVVVVIPHRLDEHLSSWRDPSSRFGVIVIRLASGSEERMCLTAARRLWMTSRIMMLYLLQCSHTTTINMFSRPSVRIGVHPPIRSLPSSESLRSSFVTLRMDNELIVDHYSPHQYSRQFGYYQDIPGALIEQHYDGSLLALVQLWVSCVYLGRSSKIIIPMHSSNKGSLMTHSSSNESNVSQELNWKHLKKKPKDLNTQQCEFAELDSISIDPVIFEDGTACSTMPLTKLAHQLGLRYIPSDVDVFEDFITRLNSLDVAKSFHLSLVEAKSQHTNEIQLTKPMVFGKG
uniref:Aminotransferase-like plant mobile domain-containing protein n=1 Tax=Solanum lycopersicum TaxID=4081 RepID=A0A3Q7EYS9_SOLLC